MTVARPAEAADVPEGEGASRGFDREGGKQAMSQHIPDTAAANSALDAARAPYGSTTFQVEAAGPSARGTGTA
jgi:hypothetical protein